MKNNVDTTIRKKVIDIEFLRDIIADDFEFEKELFAIFVENAHRNIEKMENAITNSDVNTWYMSSHAFKGAAASIGAFELSNVLEYAQKHLEENNQQKTELLNKIKTELQLVVEFINEEMLEKR